MKPTINSTTTRAFRATAISLAILGSASATTVLFDIDSVAGQGGVNLAGWIPVTGSGSTVTGTDGTYTMTVTGLASGRDRGTAATIQGADNGDNPVPIGTYGDMYRDFVFSTTGSSTTTITGLAPSTTYPVTFFSYDSGQGGVVTSEWNGAAITFQGDLVGPGPDPDTTSLNDYSVTFDVTTDPSGQATITGASTTGLHLFNGVAVGDVVPEPSTGLLGLAGALMLLRRKR